MADGAREDHAGQNSGSDVFNPADTVPVGIGLYCLFAGVVAFFSLEYGLIAIGHTEQETARGFGLVFSGVSMFGIIYGLLQLREWGWRLGALSFCLHGIVTLVTASWGPFLFDIFMFLYLLAIQHYYLAD